MVKGKYKTGLFFHLASSIFLQFCHFNCFFYTYGSEHLLTVLRLFKYLSTCHCNLNPAPSCAHTNIEAHMVLCQSPEHLVCIIICTIICSDNLFSESPNIHQIINSHSSFWGLQNYYRASLTGSKKSLHHIEKKREALCYYWKEDCQSRLSRYDIFQFTF